MLVFAQRLCCEDKIVYSQHFAWISAAGTKWPQFSILYHVHCPSKLSPLQHRNEPISASCTPSCVLSLHHAWIPGVYMKELVPSSPPRNMCPSVWSSVVARTRKSCSFRTLKIVTAIDLSQIFFRNFLQVFSVLVTVYSRKRFKPKLNSSLS